MVNVTLVIVKRYMCDFGYLFTPIRGVQHHPYRWYYMVLQGSVASLFAVWLRVGYRVPQMRKSFIRLRYQSERVLSALRIQ